MRNRRDPRVAQAIRDVESLPRRKSFTELDGSDDIIARAFRVLRETDDEQLKNSLARFFEPLAYALWRRFTVQSPDTLQAAFLGLAKSIARFDPDYGVPFQGFASTNIIGEMKRYMRDGTWRIRVPRPVQEAVLAIRDMLTCNPHMTPEEAAAKCGISEELYQNAMLALTAQNPASLTAAIGSRSGDSSDTSILAEIIGSKDTGFDGVDTRMTVQRLLTMLQASYKDKKDGERLVKIVAMRYYGNMTQAEIAKQIGISQMHVSRLLARALVKMKELLEQ